MGTPDQSASSRSDILKSAPNLAELRTIRHQLDQGLRQLQADAKNDITMNLEKVLEGIEELGRLREYLETAFPDDNERGSATRNAGDAIVETADRIVLADSRPDVDNATK